MNQLQSYEITYTLVGDYYIPNIALPEENRPIGKWGRMHREYLKEHLNNLGAVDPAVRRKVSHSIYTCFCLCYGMRSGISCKACYRTADAARA